MFCDECSSRGDLWEGYECPECEGELNVWSDDMEETLND
jgi:hypothetical protein